MKILRLPHGPWKLLLGGNFEGYPLSIYQNPDRDLLVVVVDREEGKPKGVVVVMYRGFYALGPVDALVEGVKRELIVLKKKREDGIYNFVLLQGGPKYIGLSSKELEDAVDMIGNALYKDAELFMKIARGFDVELKQLRDCEPRIVSVLLSEPLLLPKLVRTPKTTIEETPMVVLGKTRVGIAKEIVEEFRRAVIEGPHTTARKRFLLVLLEELARLGYPVILFTRDISKLSGLSEASDEDLSAYGLRPIGFHWKPITPGKDVFVELGTVDPNAFLDVIGVKGKVGDILVSALQKRPVGIEDLRNAVQGERFVDGRARRVIKVVELKHGHYIGINDVSPFLAKGEVGAITVFAYREEPWHLLTMQSFLEKLFLFTSKRGIRDVFILFEDAHRLFMLADSPLNKALAASLLKLMGQKIGVVLECEDSAFLRKEVTEKIETSVKTINDEEVGVRPLTRRPYRVEIRPFLSKIRLLPAPSTSSLPVPQLGGT